MMEKLNRYEKLESKGAYLTFNTMIECENDILENIVKKVMTTDKQQNSYATVSFVKKVDEELKFRINQTFGDVYKDDEDGYVIEAGDDEVHIVATSLRGLVYGAYSLQQLGENGFLRKGLIYNIPLCPFRGIKVYLPAREDVEFFKAFVDMACYYRYNTIILEIGGAMEYKRHPEINEGWVEYSKEMREYSGKAEEIQKAFTWEKNSIHCDNGGGGWLTQETVRDMVVYCKERGLIVIPEVPCLSHSDYLLTRHPELVERREDPYPDTYCPSNPASYELLFDVIDEVIAVFNPLTIHIAHDEYYSIGICDQCKAKDAVEIFVEDLKKIYAYLAEKGIQTMIWGDKLLNCITRLGQSHGGASIEIFNEEALLRQFIPHTYPAIDRIPSDMQIMHWYWYIREEYDEDFLSRDLYMVYGNFHGPGIPNWSHRLARGVQGASLSNWGAMQEDVLQRNAIFFDMVYCCRMFWKEGYEENNFASLAEETFTDLFIYKNREILSGSHIEITYGTNYKQEYKMFYDSIFIDPQQDYLGEYVITFEDGSMISTPVNYGLNISSFDKSWTTKYGEDYEMLENDNSLLEVSGNALPVRENSKTYYKIVIGNPFPEKKLTSFEFISKEDFNIDVVTQKVIVK